MPVFTDQQRAYLAEQRLGRLATVGPEGHPHVVPTGFRFDPAEEVIDIGGHNIAGSKKFRDARANPRVAFVVDDLASTEPWRPRAIEIRGLAQTFTEGGERLGPGFGPAWIRITPTHVVAWGLDLSDDAPRGR
jgi:pyridoxamine 5'-phosphate oxidase family protein